MAASPATTRVTNNEGLILPCYQPQVIAWARQNSLLPPGVATLTIQYASGEDDAFGTREWQEYWNVTVPKVQLSCRFYETFWFQPDRFNSTKLNCDTHTMPVLCPTRVQKAGSQNAGFYKYCLKGLQKLVAAQTSGTAVQFAVDASIDTEAFARISETSARGFVWLILRETPLTRDGTFVEQAREVQRINETRHTQYEVTPSLLELTTAVTAIHAKTSQRYFAKTSARFHAEDRETMAFCCDFIEQDGTMYQLTMGRFAAIKDRPSILSIQKKDRERDDNDTCMSGLVRFPVE